jgi:hypothetical protein
MPAAAGAPMGMSSQPDARRRPDNHKECCGDPSLLVSAHSIPPTMDVIATGQADHDDQE